MIWLFICSIDHVCCIAFLIGLTTSGIDFGKKVSLGELLIVSLKGKGVSLFLLYRDHNAFET